MARKKNPLSLPDEDEPVLRRRKGASLRAKEMRQAIALGVLEDGITPLEVMISAMRKAVENGDEFKAVQYAQMAAPYVHPKIASINVTSDEPKESVTNNFNIQLVSSLTLKSLVRGVPQLTDETVSIGDSNIIDAEMKTLDAIDSAIKGDAS